MLFVRHWSSKWSQEKCIKRADVDLDPMTQHTAKILQAAHIWVWSTLLLISAGWGNHCPKYLGFVVDKVSIYRVIRVQLTHWNFCCKTIIDYPSLRAKEDFFFYYHYSHFEEFAEHSAITVRVARKERLRQWLCLPKVALPKLHQKTAKKLCSPALLHGGYYKRYANNVKREEDGWRRQHCPSVSVAGSRLPQTHSSMPLLMHSIWTPPEKKLMVTGQHMDAVQATRQLDAGWRNKGRVLTTQQVLLCGSPEQFFFSKLFLLYCVGSKAPKGVAEWTLPGDTWDGRSRHAMRNRPTTACSPPWGHLSFLT